MKKILFFIIIFTTAFIMSCTKPYRTPDVNPSDAPFDGLNTTIKSRAVSLIMIHGMCNHDKQWILDNAKQFASPLNMELGQLVPIYNGGPLGVNAYRVDLQKNNRKVSIYGIIYSLSTLPIKQQQLCSDTSEETDVCPTIEYDRTRAKINAAIKNELMNDCLADAVIYLGKAGKDIRDGVRNSLVSIHEDRMKEDSLKESDVFLLSESLGSKILKDSLLCDSSKTVQKIEQTLGNIAQVFLVSNQIPLLDLGDNQLDCGGKFNEMFDLFDISKEKMFKRKGLPGVPNPVKVVAFTDPNDLLSYEVESVHYGNRVVVNIVVSNTYTWFWLLENPLSAHTGYLRNPNVIKYIACGREKNGNFNCIN